MCTMYNVHCTCVGSTVDTEYGEGMCVCVSVYNVLYVHCTVDTEYGEGMCVCVCGEYTRH